MDWLSPRAVPRANDRGSNVRCLGAGVPSVPNLPCCGESDVRPYRRIETDGTHRVIIAAAALSLAFLGFTQAAQATEVVIPSGGVAKVTDVKFSACNDLTFNYQLDAGAKVELGNKTYGCFDLQGPDATIGPFSEAHVLRFGINDNTCGYTFS